MLAPTIGPTPGKKLAIAPIPARADDTNSNCSPVVRLLHDISFSTKTTIVDQLEAIETPAPTAPKALPKVVYTSGFIDGNHDAHNPSIFTT